MNATPRPNTPDVVTYDEQGGKSIRITTKRACNGCGQLLGDISSHEMALAIAGAPLPDVRSECPACAPTAPPPACRPTRIVSGDVLCLGLDCDHELTAGEYCDEVGEETVCGTHSETAGDGEVTRVEPWPCQHAALKPTG
ncbi:hypothetical protein [Streptomyces sp. NPDC102487]|uniref:hypothetical protein n=1 Tax=Streptomyces sp. NPDC102487 TaxID=3366182 RepID=UPI0037FCFE91